MTVCTAAVTTLSASAPNIQNISESEMSEINQLDSLIQHNNYKALVDFHLYSLPKHRGRICHVVQEYFPEGSRCSFIELTNRVKQRGGIGKAEKRKVHFIIPPTPQAEMCVSDRFNNFSYTCFFFFFCQCINKQLC